jgi:hypothetical protein
MAAVHVMSALSGWALPRRQGLSVAATQTLLTKITDQSLTIHGQLRIAHREMSKVQTLEVELQPALALTQHWGWSVAEEDGDELKAFAEALNTFAEAGVRICQENLDAYVGAMRKTAELEIAGISGESAVEGAHEFILAAVLAEPLLLSLRRLAQQDVLRRRMQEADSTEDCAV